MKLQLSSALINSPTLCIQDEKELNLPPCQSCIDLKHNAQLLFYKSSKKTILVALVPPHCTDRLQLLDITVNKSVKEFLRAEFHDWYSKQVCKQLEGSKDDVQPVDLLLTIVKPLNATWIKNLMDYLQLHP